MPKASQFARDSKLLAGFTEVVLWVIVGAAYAAAVHPTRL